MPESLLPPSRPVPPRVGRYDVLLPIASGGMATVYLARSQGARGFARDVALKLTHAHLNDENSEFAAILLEEARIASRIKHRNVVSILDVGEDPLGLFLVMDYVEGDTLAGLLRGAPGEPVPLPGRVGVRILLDALAGLHAAHELTDDAGAPMAVVHRDFSPQNILVGLDGVAQLADFGIAKAADRGGETATGIVKGKVAYMAPEHARSRPIDRRADVWSAGVVAWEIFAGRRLHPGSDGLAIALKIVSERPPLLSAIVPDIRPEVEAAVARALEPSLEKRTPSAAIFAKELAGSLGMAGRPADHEEVAEYVRRVSGPKLDRRRARVLEVLRRREKGASPSKTPEPEPASAPTPPVALPADRVAKTVPAPEQAPAAQEASPVAEAPPSERPDDPTALALGLAPTEELPALAADDPEDLADPTVTPRPSLPVPTSMTETASSADGPWRPSRAPASGVGVGRAWIALAAAAAFAGSVTLLALGLGYGRKSGTGGVASGAAPTAPTRARSPEPAKDPPSAEEAGPSTAVVRLHANSKVSSLRVNARTVAVIPPATDLSFDRASEEWDAPVAIVATSLDGRKRAATLPVGAVTLEIDFPPFPQRPTLGTPLAVPR